MADLIHSGRAQIAVVTWYDAHTESEWADLNDLDLDPYIVQSCGWLIPDLKPGHTCLIQSIGSDDAVDAILCIPQGMVVKLVLVDQPFFQ